jgi:hypothetical protein
MLILSNYSLKNYLFKKMLFLDVKIIKKCHLCNKFNSIDNCSREKSKETYTSY